MRDLELRKNKSFSKLSASPTVQNLGYNQSSSMRVVNRVLNCFGLIYILNGGGLYEDEKNGKRRVSKGNVLLLFPGFRHTYIQWDFPVWTEYFLSYDARIFRFLEQEGVVTRARPVLSPGLSPNLISMFKTLVEDVIHNRVQDEEVLRARIYLLIAQILSQHQARGGDKINEFVLEACQTLDKELETRMDLRKVARSFHLSYPHFRKLFTEHVGIPPIRYRVFRRIGLAKRLIMEEKLPVKSVARRLGYSDLHFFYRQFKQIAGSTVEVFKQKGFA